MKILFNTIEITNNYFRMVTNENFFESRNRKTDFIMTRIFLN